MENREPHVGLSKHDSVFPGTSMGHFKLPLGSRRQVTWEELEWAVPCAHGLRDLAGAMSRELPLPNWVPFYCKGSSPGGQPQSPA